MGVSLYACGGRTLDDGVYGYQPAGSSSTCVYRGTTYRDGAFIAANCACFCNSGQIECEQGCTIASGGNSSGGNSSGGTVGVGNASNGGSSAGGWSGGTAGVGNASSGGAAFGGSSGMSSGGSAGESGGAANGGGSVGGSVGMGGVAGTGGVAFCGPPPRATGMAPLIDDMEDGDAAILPSDGRSGGWFVYNDGSPNGYQFPSLSGFEMQGGSDATLGEFSARTFGKGFRSWGAGMGFVLNNGCPYDASEQKGLHFFVRGEFGPGSIYLLVATAATTPNTSHGTCIPSPPTACYDNYQTTILVGPEWSEQTIPFHVLNQQGWGTPAAFDPRTLINVNFQTLFGSGDSFSFSVDAISFY